MSFICARRRYLIFRLRIADMVQDFQTRLLAGLPSPEREGGVVDETWVAV
jgi:hypothetical protein